MATLAEPIVHGKPVESQLKTNTLTLFDTTVIATSSVAPAYTLAATVGFLVASGGPGVAGCHPRRIPPGALHRHRLLLPQSSGPELRCVVLVGQPDAQPAHRMAVGMDSARGQRALLRGGSADCRGVHAAAPQQSFPQFGQRDMRQRQPAASPSSALLWLLFVTFMVVRGIRITANFQWILVFIEYFIVLAFRDLRLR